MTALEGLVLLAGSALALAQGGVATARFGLAPLHATASFELAPYVSRASPSPPDATRAPQTPEIAEGAVDAAPADTADAQAGAPRAEADLARQDIPQPTRSQSPP